MSKIAYDTHAFAGGLSSDMVSTAETIQVTQVSFEVLRNNGN